MTKDNTHTLVIYDFVLLIYENLDFLIGLLK